MITPYNLQGFRNFVKLLLVFHGAIAAFLFLDYLLLQSSFSLPFISSSKFHWSADGNNYNRKDEYAISTAGCRLLETSIWPDYFKNDWNWQKYPSPNCDKYFKFASLSDDEKTLKVNADFLSGQCSLWQVQHYPDDDNNFMLVDRGKIYEAEVNVEDVEMMKIECDGVSNFEARVPIKTPALEKMKYWKKRASESKPYSIILMGYDSTSRKHALRGFTKTHSIMKEMGFLDFQGHHTIMPRTLPNFLAFTSGQNEIETRSTCSPQWANPYDDCPFIWKNYAAHNAVTLLIEDPPGTLNYDGQSGFKKPPTDYYIHPLFQSLREVAWGREWESVPCVSSETTFGFIKRYMRRFMEKFEGNPYLILNYNTELFNYFPFAVPSHDEDLSEFFQFLNDSPDVRENTLVILTGDHGDGSNIFSYDSIDAYMERSIAPLFVRFPDRLARKHPHLIENAKKNTKRLTTAYDIHHTMLHLLALSGLQVNTMSGEKFLPCLPDRCSLLEEISETRTCDSVKITPNFCVCNSTPTSRSLTDKFFTNQLVDFAIHELNSIVKGSKYADMCEEWLWLYMVDTLVSVSTLEETEDQLKILLHFSPTHKKWETEGEVFQVNMKVWKQAEITQAGAIELIGDFNRISGYMEQSWCVDKDDEYLRTLCYCRPEKKTHETM